MPTTPNSSFVSEVALEAERCFPECLQLLRNSIAIESYSGKEGEQARLLLQFFAQHHIPAFVDLRGSVLAFLIPEAWGNDLPSPGDCDSQTGIDYAHHLLQRARQEGLPTLAYNAHMDIVEAGDRATWNYAPFQSSIEDGRIYGRGTCDMKGALAAMAMAIVAGRKIATSHPLQRLIIGCFVTEEEASEGLSFMEIIRNEGIRPETVLLGEPSMMEIARGQRGKVEFIVRGRGKRAHTSVPEVGDNALYKVARAVLALEELDRKEFSAVGSDPARILQRSTLVAAAVETIPFATGSVPDLAEAHVIARLAEGETFATITEKLQQTGRWPQVEMELKKYHGTSYTGRTTEWRLEHLAWQVPREHGFFQFLAQAYQTMLHRPPVDKIWPFSTDGVFSAGEEKIPTLGIGPGRENVAHTVDEYIELHELQEALALYTFLPFA